MSKKSGQRRIREFTWGDYGISTYRYRELKNFCLQYDEKKNKMKYGLRAINNDGMPKGNQTGNPTESRALENYAYEQDCKMIEKAAMDANPIIWKYLLRSVTQDLSYELIEFDEELGRIPIGRTDFYGYRRKFFANLNHYKNGYK